LTDIITNLIKEKNEFSRIPIFDVIVSLQNHKNVAKMNDFLFTAISNLSNDDCWRVRYTVSEKLHEVLFY